MELFNTLVVVENDTGRVTQEHTARHRIPDTRGKVWQVVRVRSTLVPAGTEDGISILNHAVSRSLHVGPT